MDTRSLLAAPLIVALAGSVAAAPAPRVTEAPQPRPAEVVLASAEQARTPTPSEQPQVATPAKRPRAARVTSCRCAGQAGAGPDQSGQ